MIMLNDNPSSKLTLTSYGNEAGDYINTWNLADANWGKVYYYVNDPSWNYDDGTGNIVDYTDTWMDDGLVPCATEIGAGPGFWYYAVDNGVTLTFSAK